jgi:hypothetical protein
MKIFFKKYWLISLTTLFLFFVFVALLSNNFDSSAAAVFATIAAMWAAKLGIGYYVEQQRKTMLLEHKLKAYEDFLHFIAEYRARILMQKEDTEQDKKEFMIKLLKLNIYNSHKMSEMLEQCNNFGDMVKDDAKLAKFVEEYCNEVCLDVFGVPRGKQ